MKVVKIELKKQFGSKDSQSKADTPAILTKDENKNKSIQYLDDLKVADVMMPCKLIQINWSYTSFKSLNKT